MALLFKMVMSLMSLMSVSSGVGVDPGDCFVEGGEGSVEGAVGVVVGPLRTSASVKPSAMRLGPVERPCGSPT